MPLKTPLILPFQCWCCGTGVTQANTFCAECAAVFIALQASPQTREPLELAAAL